MTAIRTLATIVILATGFGGCAAIGLTGAAVGASAFSAGAGAVVDAGREYTSSGAVYRTFSVPLPELRRVVVDALDQMDLAVVHEEERELEHRMVAVALGREIQIRLQPVTRTVTRVRLVVTEGYFGKDRSTATEIVRRTERAVDERTAAAPAPLRRGAPGTAASSLARGARR